MLKKGLREYFSIPNLLTYFRILIIPFFVWSYLAVEKPTDYLLPAVLILLSGLTDAADGYIARHFNMVTDWGKLVDPIADKLTQAALAACLVVRYPYIAILLAILVVKELQMLVITVRLYTKHRVKLNGALWYGKIATAVFYAVVLILVAYPPMPKGIAYVMIGVSGFFMILSGVLYNCRLYRLYREHLREEAAEND